jgi:hypothetical protein
MSKTSVVILQRKINLHIHSTSHGTLDTKIKPKEIPKIFLHISVVKNVVTYDNVEKHLVATWGLKIPSNFNINSVTKGDWLDFILTPMIIVAGGHAVA